MEIERIAEFFNEMFKLSILDAGKKKKEEKETSGVRFSTTISVSRFLGIAIISSDFVFFT